MTSCGPFPFELNVLVAICDVFNFLFGQDSAAEVISIALLCLLKAVALVLAPAVFSTSNTTTIAVPGFCGKEMGREVELCKAVAAFCSIGGTPDLACLSVDGLAWLALGATSTECFCL
ncbi:hypothetical protein BDZ91DRAFT_225900 [Kalaharituber pfeilii]|nr:hypothetical protein BDZ91DRAFT_225900 [Kalaharituber pfeilii]